MSKMNEEVKNRMTQLLEDGKKTKEVLAMMQGEGYEGVNLAQVANLKTRLKKQSGDSPRTAKKPRKTKSAKPVIEGIDAVIAEIQTFKESHTEVLRFIRLELIKARHELFDVKMQAKIDMTLKMSKDIIKLR